MYHKIRHSHLFLVILSSVFKHNKQTLKLTHLCKIFYSDLKTLHSDRKNLQAKQEILSLIQLFHVESYQKILNRAVRYSAEI